MVKVEFCIVGIISDPEYQKCAGLGKALENEDEDITVKYMPMVEVDFQRYLQTETAELGAEAVQHKTSPLVFYNGKNYVGGTAAFVEIASRKYEVAVPEKDEFYVEKAQVSFLKYCSDSGHDFCWIEFSFGEGKVGRVIIELFTDICPKTCDNFRVLCNGDAEPLNGIPLKYEGTPIHRVVPGGWIQGGDIINKGAGDGEGHSIYGKNFADESFAVSHDRAGIVSMANCGPHTNGSQFFITLGPAKWLDKHKVAFGRVIKGMSLVHEIAALPLEKERPTTPCIISACSQMTI